MQVTGDLDDVDDRRFADAALGDIDDALEPHEIVRILQNAQIRRHILDLLAILKAHAAVDTVRDLIAHHRAFHAVREGIHTVQHGKIRVGLAICDFLFNGIADELSLIALTRNTQVRDFLALADGSPEFLLFS